MSYDINKEYNILEIADEISKKLQVNPDKFRHIIQEKIPFKNRIIRDKTLLQKIFSLLVSDVEINKFESKIKNPVVLNSFGKMKEKLAELQVLTLIKKLEKSESCDDMIHSFITVLNNKIDNVNEILEDSLIQSGGGNNHRIENSENYEYYEYYLKYLKYKIKNNKLELIVSDL